MTQNVILNLKSPQAIQTDIAFTQGDYGEAKLTIAVKDDEQYITGDTGASISFLRADGNIVTGELSGTQGMYGYTFAGNELETSGKTVATVTIEYDGGRVSTAAFIFTVRYNPAYDKKIPAGPYITALEKIKNQAQTYVEYLSALIEQLQPDIGSAALTKADLVNGYTQTVAGIKAFDAAAAKTLKEIVDGKIDATKIVNNLLSTDASMVLSAALGPIIDQRLTDLLEKYNRLNGDIITGVDRFPPANTGTQEITVNFPEPMRGAPKVFAMWEDTTITLTYVDKLVITGATSSGFKIATNRLKPSENWWFCYIAIYNR